MKEIEVFYDEKFLWGECFEQAISYENHNLSFRYKLTDENDKIIHIYECKKCNALVAFYFYKGKQFSSYISFPEVLFKHVKCGEKFSKIQIIKKILSSFDKRMYTNFKAGIFSGFSLCCTLYFSLIRSLPANPGFYADIKYIVRRRKFNDFNLSHIMCPICSLRNYNVEGKADTKYKECIDASLFDAIKSAIKWRLLDDEAKTAHNETYLRRSTYQNFFRRVKEDDI